MSKRLIWSWLLLLCTTAWGANEKEITVELTVPDAAWEITIDEVHRVGDALWVISTVSRDPDLMGAQVISTVRASLRLEAPDLPTKHFVIGKSWDWQNQEPYTFLSDTEPIEDDLKHAEVFYRRRQKD